MKQYIFNILLATIFLTAGCRRPVEPTQTETGIPPSVPTGLYVYYASDGEVTIAWNNNPETDLKGYNIYRSSDSLNYRKIFITQHNYYFDDSLSYDSTYFYKITALDNFDEESLPTLPVSAKPLNNYPPSIPRFIKINARNWESDLSVYLNWTPNSESDVMGYNIYKDSLSGFTADSSSFLAFTRDNQYSDTVNVRLYHEYYYKIKAVDKGNLISKESDEVSDQIFGIPKLLFPGNNSVTDYFNAFKILSVKRPADYKLVLQDNQFISSIWEHEFSSQTIDDTIYIDFQGASLSSTVNYYWRIVTYSHNTPEPNSVSPLYKFMIKQ